MRVLVVGKGGREHALAQKISESRQTDRLWVAPGNPGMVLMGLECVDLERTADVLEFCEFNHVDLVVLGPEAAILSDLKVNLEAKGISCLAPSPEAAQLEASKIFCKKVLINAQLPTAPYEVVRDLTSGMALISKHNFANPLVIKADGLAQGKGVHVCATQEQAIQSLSEVSRNYGFPVLFEQCLSGRELSAFALCDGEDFILLGTACDYKRINASVFSANTGGMGAYSPCDFLTEQDEEDISEIFRKSLKAMKKQGTPFAGFLFAGLMKTEQGIFVLEFNVRLGDPETQALLPRIESDFLELMVKSMQGRLKSQRIEFKPDQSVHVVVASQGYPGSHMELGHTIEIPRARQEAQIYFSGVSTKEEKLVNSGGRVLGVTALAQTREEARRKVYETISGIQFKGRYFREDIAL